VRSAAVPRLAIPSFFAIIQMFVRDLDPFMRAWPQAFEADKASRADFGWLVLGVLLILAVALAAMTLRWVSRGGLRRSPAARFSIH